MPERMTSKTTTTTTKNIMRRSSSSSSSHYLEHRQQQILKLSRKLLAPSSCLRVVHTDTEQQLCQRLLLTKTRNDYVTMQQVQSEVNTMADRLDMQCRSIVPFVGQRVKGLVRRLLETTAEDTARLYLQTLVLLSRAPVQAMYRKSREPRSSRQQILSDDDADYSTVIHEEEDDCVHHPPSEDYLAWKESFRRDNEKTSFLSWEEDDEGEEEDSQVIYNDKDEDHTTNTQGDDKVPNITTTSKGCEGKVETEHLLVNRQETTNDLFSSYHKMRHYGMEAVDQIDNYVYLHPTSTAPKNASQDYQAAANPNEAVVTTTNDTTHTSYRHQPHTTSSSSLYTSCMDFFITVTTSASPHHYHHHHNKC